ncbi:hypothetical protein DM02DRAFT_692677 [Periconia macrospinosa]|uniref:Zinc finger PHD-type domain-containing protein n=1 Tax=Periconia macrospinosa TaxID=97972 RepID=A0A2V1D903_9PLEO|nr:hypothetical protein DM02DRAFT_692677 [Periconia macrospinosa]
MALSNSHYRWEDGPHLQHHCGFCDRPLAHPGAKVSCFGTHAEPCWRFHQIMFMRSRGHTCSMCRAIEEAHEKRHMEIAQRLRIIYDLSGSDMSIIPDDEQERQNDESGLTASHAEALTKRERKEQKRLARAASRPNIITTEDRQYISGVLHTSGGHNNLMEPINSEEIAEIEKHLRYHANIYANSKSLRSTFAEFPQFAADDIDFEQEMSRILQTFRVTELQGQNRKNQGLVGRELKDFESAITAFKQIVIEDIVLLKRDELEVRMRRAAYLRYTNRAAYEVVLDRYAVKDWKTGEKLIDPGKTPSKSETISEDRSFADDQEDRHPVHSHAKHLSTPRNPIKVDDRHLTMPYKVLGDYDMKFDDTPIPWEQVNQSHSDIDLEMPKWPGILAIRHPDSTRELQNTRQKFQESARNAPWSHVHLSHAVQYSTPAKVDGPLHEKEDSSFPKLPNPHHENRKTSVEPQPSPTKLPAPNEVPPLVGKKKKDKKKKRETERKARRAIEKEIQKGKEEIEVDAEWEATIAAGTTPEEEAELTGQLDEQPTDQENKNMPATRRQNTRLEASPMRSDALSSVDNESYTTAPSSPNSFGSIASSHHVRKSPPLHADVTSLPPPLAVTQTGHWTHWKQFAGEFQVDKLSQPTNSCVFEATHTFNCPMHHHNAYCKCHSSEADRFWIVYPRDGTAYIGPFNQFLATKLISELSAFPRLDKKLTVIHDEIRHWAEADAQSRMPVRPPELEKEVEDYSATGHKGVLMMQVEMYQGLRYINRCRPADKHVTIEELRKYYKKCRGDTKKMRVCYCQDVAPKEFNDKDFITCSYAFCDRRCFHRECVQKGGGIGENTEWYCFRCDILMKEAARRAVEEVNAVRDWEVLGPEPLIHRMPQSTLNVAQSLRRMMEELWVDGSGNDDVCDVEDVD